MEENPQQAADESDPVGNSAPEAEVAPEPLSADETGRESAREAILAPNDDDPNAEESTDDVRVASTAGSPSHGKTDDKSEDVEGEDHPGERAKSAHSDSSEKRAQSGARSAKSGENSRPASGRMSNPDGAKRSSVTSKKSSRRSSAHQDAKTSRTPSAGNSRPQSGDPEGKKHSQFYVTKITRARRLWFFTILQTSSLFDDPNHVHFRWI